MITWEEAVPATGPRAGLGLSHFGENDLSGGPRVP